MVIRKKRRISKKPKKRHKDENYRSSTYIGVTKNYEGSKTKKAWQARIRIDGKNQHLGSFKTEIEAAKYVNFVCKKESMELKNPELSDKESEHFIWPLILKKKSSKYVGVSRNSKRKTPWHARISIDRKLTHLGYFKTEIAAAKHINLVCKKIGMKLKNPGISEEKETILNKEVILKKELSPEKEEEKITWGNFFTT